jgi:hypothetical protein
MRLWDELRDPWGLLVAATGGGLTWAIAGNEPIAIPAAIGVAAIALAVKSVTGALMGDKKPAGGELLPVRQGSPEEAWFGRAQNAARSLRDVAAGARPGPIAERLDQVVKESAGTIDDLRRLAGQASAVTAAMWRVDVPTLQRELKALQRSRNNAASPKIQLEIDRAILGMQGQLDVHERLYDVASSLLARMQSGTVGLESLVARVAELVAIADASPSAVTGVAELDELASELEALRLGLAETEELSRRALGEESHAPELPVISKDMDSSRDRGRAGPLQGGN